MEFRTEAPQMQASLVRNRAEVLVRQQTDTPIAARGICLGWRHHPPCNITLPARPRPCAHTPHLFGDEEHHDLDHGGLIGGAQARVGLARLVAAEGNLREGLVARRCLEPVHAAPLDQLLPQAFQHVVGRAMAEQAILER
eukprot:15282430-Alexandrium_andersonii.AAC.1